MPPDSRTWIDITLWIWFSLTILSVSYVAWDLITRTPEMKIMKWAWVLVTLYVGPTIVLLAKMPLIGHAARRARKGTSSSADLHTAGIQLAVHAVGGLLVLLVITALSVYKPWGLTRYGQRKQQELRDQTRRSPQTVEIKAMSGPSKETIGDSLSRGLRISLAGGAGALVVLVHASVYLTGHGFQPGR